MSRIIPGILAGLTSLPLTYLALHSHRELRHLRRSHHALRELLVEVREDDAAPWRRGSSTPPQ